MDKKQAQWPVTKSTDPPSVIGDPQPCQFPYCPDDPPVPQGYCTLQIAYPPGNPDGGIMYAGTRPECQVSVDLALTIMLAAWLRTH